MIVFAVEYTVAMDDSSFLSPSEVIPITLCILGYRLVFVLHINLD